MKIIVIGAGGTIGKAVVSALENDHEIIGASRNGEIKVNLSDPEAIRTMYDPVPHADAIICAAGSASFGPLSELSDDDFTAGLSNKLMGQINLVRYGLSRSRNSVTYILTSGLLAHRPGPATSLLSVINSGIEAFVRAAALELPPGHRINGVCPPLVRETAEKLGWGPGGIPAADVAAYYVEALLGDESGQIFGPEH